MERQNEKVPVAAVAERQGKESTHASAVQGMFTRIAPTYDLLNRVLSLGFDRRWRALAVQALRTAKDGELLDLCAGTLDLTVLLEAEFPTHRIRAIDFTEAMLERGRHKVSRAKLEVGDAMALTAPAGTFAGVVCGFGLRNLSNPELGLREMRRVLMPGGTLVILEFFRPEGALGAVSRGVHAVYARGVMPIVGRMGSGDASAYDYLAKSMAEFLSLDEARDLLQSLGFEQVSARRLAPFGIASLVTAVAP